MKLLSFITPEDLKPQFESKYNTEVFGRIAARGVLINEKKEIGLMYIAKFDSYKLPGGGVDDEENIVKALEREMIEETGYKTEIIQELGMTVERRSGDEEKGEIVQVSLNYLVKPLELVGVNLTEKEKDEGFKLTWVENIDKAIELIRNSYKNIEDLRYISLRDESILIKAEF
jgi:ADP-ribose pyrophosphatase YjhB (NUDIX family)